MKNLIITTLVFKIIARKLYVSKLKFHVLLEQTKK